MPRTASVLKPNPPKAVRNSHQPADNPALTVDKMTAVLSPALTARVRHLAENQKIRPPEIIRRAVTAYEFLAGLQEGEVVLVKHTDSGETERVRFNW